MLTLNPLNQTKLFVMLGLNRFDGFEEEDKNVRVYKTLTLGFSNIGALGLFIFLHVLYVHVNVFQHAVHTVSRFYSLVLALFSFYVVVLLFVCSKEETDRLKICSFSVSSYPYD